jgi:hypothetical protein
MHGWYLTKHGGPAHCRSGVCWGCVNVNTTYDTYQSIKQCIYDAPAVNCWALSCCLCASLDTHTGNVTCAQPLLLPCWKVERSVVGNWFDRAQDVNKEGVLPCPCLCFKSCSWQGGSWHTMGLRQLQLVGSLWSDVASATWHPMHAF